MSIKRQKTLPKRPNFQQACLWICETKNKAFLDNLLIFEENTHWLEKEIPPVIVYFSNSDLTLPDQEFAGSHIVDQSGARRKIETPPPPLRELQGTPGRLQPFDCLLDALSFLRSPLGQQCQHIF